MTDKRPVPAKFKNNFIEEEKVQPVITGSF